jgi:hypothetical protein
MKFALICLLMTLIAACSNDATDGGTPHADVQVTTLEFDTVSIGWKKLLTVQIGNTGTGTLHISDIRVAGGQDSSFTVTSATAFDLGPGRSDLIQVEFRPRVEWANNATLTVISNAAEQPVVALHGTGRFPGHGNDAVVAKLIDGAPIIDGEGDDPAWNIAPPTSLTFMQIVPDHLLDAFSSDSRRNPFEGELRAVYTIDSVYFRVSWSDPDENSTPGRWHLNGSDPSQNWQREQSIQDGFSFIFPVSSTVTGHETGQTFANSGCAASCHPTASLQSYEGGHFPASGTVDVWYWQAGLGNTIGYADDQVARGGDGGAQSNLRRPDSDAPVADLNYLTSEPLFPPYMAGGTNGGFDPLRVLWKPTAAAFNPAVTNPATGRAWAQGDEIPGWLLSPPADDRGDVHARGRYHDGVWTVEFARRLTTGSANDVQFNIDGSEYFGVAVHDRQRMLSPDEYRQHPSIPYPSHYGITLMRLIFN